MRTYRNYQPRSILITGGAGFIGSNFIHSLLKNEPHCKIINLDKLTYAGSLDNVGNLPVDRHHFIQGDITDVALVDHVMQHHCIDTIVHFAAETHVDRSIQNPSTFVESNVTGTYTLLEAARHHWFDIDECPPTHCHFHHISTDEVYGSLDADAPASTEQSLYQPRSPYSATKASSDHLVNAYHYTYQLPITLSHCSNNYGPKQHSEKFIPSIIRACLMEQPITIYGNGRNRRDWLHVADHCRGILSIIKHGKVGECYNMGAGNEWENIALANYICQLLDRLSPAKKSYAELLKFVPDRPGHDFRYAINTTKIQQELNWQPQIKFEDGIIETIKFYSHQLKNN